MFASWSWGLWLDAAAVVTQLAAHWLLQSTVLIAAGLVAGRWLRHRGPAVESAVYRTTIVMVLAAPLVARLLSAGGLTFATLELPALRVLSVAGAPVVAPTSREGEESTPPVATNDERPQIAQPNQASADFSDPRFPSSEPNPSRPSEVAMQSVPFESPSIAPADEFETAVQLPPAEEASLAVSLVIRPWIATIVVSVACVWLAGGCVLFARLWREYGRLRTICRTAVAAHEEERRECARWAERMKVAMPALRRTPLVSSPCLAGIRRPVILLPEEMSGLPLSAVLIHELAHLRRGDSLWNLLRQMLTALLFFQPLAWRLSRRLESAAEEVCDDYVVGFGADRHLYAESLVGLAERSLLPASTAVVSLVTLRSLLSQRVIRILDDTRRLTLTVGLIGLSLIAIAALGATLLAGLIGPAGPTSAVADEIAETSDSDDESNAAVDNSNAEAATKQTTSAEPQPADKVQFHFRGRVVDPDGQGVAGAKIYLVHWLPESALGGNFEPSALTAADGWFDFAIAGDAEDHIKPTWSNLAAQAAGFGFAVQSAVVFETTGEARKRISASDWERLKPRVEHAQPTLKLVRDDAPITGDVMTIEGQPVAGARVQVKSVSWNNEESLDAWEKAAREEKADYYSVRRSVELYVAGMELPSIVADGVADKNGKFTLRGVGRERIVELIISGPGIETTIVNARTREGERVVVPNEWRSGREREDIFWARVVKHVAGPAKSVRGRITDAETGEPLSGVWVHVTHQTPLKRSTFVDDNPRVAAESDEQGYYQLDGLGVGRKKTLHTVCPAGLAYVPTGASVQIDVDGGEVAKDIQLRRGVIVRGQVIDDRTRQGLAGRLHYYAFRDNPHLPLYAGFNNTAPQGYQKWIDQSGNFEIVVPPGPGILGFTANNHEQYRRGLGTETITAQVNDQKGETKMYRTVPHSLINVNEHVLRQIDPAVGSEALDVTLALTSGVEIPARLLDPNGQPISGGFVSGKGGFGGGWYPIAGESFRIEGYYDDRPRELFFYHPERNLAGYFRVEGPPPKDLAIKLQPAGSIRGRLLDEAGAPIARAQLRGEGVPGENFGDANLRLATDDEGRFHVRWLVPRRKYTVRADFDNMTGRALVDASVDAPQTRDVGDVTLVSKEEPVASKPAKEPKAAAAETKNAGAINTFRPASSIPSGTARPASAHPASSEPEGDVLSVQGQVVDPLGKPVAGADVLVIRDFWDYFGVKAPLATTKSDAAGHFRIEYRKSQYQEIMTSHQWATAAIVAVVPGFGPAWVQYNDTQPGQDVTLRLAADEPLEGRIVDLEGRGIAGVRVEVARLLANDREDLTEWLDAVRRGERPSQANAHKIRFLPLDVEQLVRAATTDDQGNFRLTGLGRGRFTRLRISGAGVAFSEINAVVRPMESFVVDTKLAFSSYSTNKEPYFGTKFEYAAEPSQPIEGLVRDAKSRAPLANVRVMSNGFAGTTLVGVHTLTTTTNDLGHFRLEGMPKGEGNKILAMPAEDQPYFLCGIKVPTAPGLESVHVDINLTRGVWITGRISAKENDQGVRARIYYIPWPDNPYARELPEFKNNASVFLQGRDQTDNDGRYRVVGLPGRGLVEAVCGGGSERAYPHGQGLDDIADLPDRNAFQQNGGPFAPIKKTWPTVAREISPAESDEQITLDAALESGNKLPLDLVDPTGHAITGAIIRGQWPKGQYREEKNAGPLVDVEALWPDEKRLVLVHHEARKLGAAVRVCWNDDNPGPRTVQLLPCATITGRLLDKDGLPIRGANIRFDIIGENDFGLHLYSAATDEQGRFTNSLVPAGCEYAVYCESRQTSVQAVAKSLTPQPGETIDLGEFDVTAKERPEPKRTLALASAPAANATSPQPAKPKVQESDDDLLTVRGRVLDPAGKPVAGADVLALRVYFHYFGPRPPLSAVKSDKDGRFEIGFRKSQFVEGVSQRDQWRNTDIAAIAPGFGPAWILYDKIKPESEVTLKLVPDEPVEGRIVDLEGRGVEGAQVHVEYVLAHEKEDISPWIAALRRGVPYYQSNEFGQPHHTLSPDAPQFGATVKTDRDGRFRLAGFGKNRVLNLQLSGANIVFTTVAAITAPVEPFVIELVENRSQHYFGSRFEYPAEPSQPVEGVVRDAKTGQPIAGVRILAKEVSGKSFWGMYAGDVVSDAQGRYRFSGLPQGDENVLLALPPGDQPYLVRQFEVPQGANLAPIKLDLELHRGVWITGRVTSKASGEGVRAQVGYVPWPSNPLVKDLPEFGQFVNRINWPYVIKTDRQGNYRIVGLPGRGLVEANVVDVPFAHGQGLERIGVMPSNEEFQRMGVFAPNQDFPTAVVQIDVGEDAAEARADFALDPGGQLPIRIVDSSGAPVSDVKIKGRLPAHMYSEEAGGPDFNIVALAEKEDRLILLHQKQRQLGKALRVSLTDAKGAPLTVALERCATVKATLLDRGGAPVRNAAIKFYIHDRNMFRDLPDAKTDEHGQFAYAGLLPGCEYDIRCSSTQAGYQFLTNKLTVAPGEVIDLGKFDVTVKDRPEPKRTLAMASDDRNTEVANAPANVAEGKPALAAASEKQHISGTVVAADTGLPLAGVKLISHRRPNFKEFLAGQPGLMEAAPETSADGKFRIPLIADENGLHGDIIAYKQGYGVDWLMGSEIKLEEAITLRLGKDVPITGRVVTTEGMPVAGAEVTCEAIFRPEPALDDFLATWKKHGTQTLSRVRQRLYRGDVDMELRAKTDQDGRFQITGVGADRVAIVKLKGQGIADEATLVATRVGFDPRQFNEAALAQMPRMSDFSRDLVLSAPEMTIVAEPEFIIEGVVRDADSREPLANCQLMAGFGWDQAALAKSDAEGKYRLTGIPKLKSYIVSARFDEGASGYLNRSIRVKNVSDAGPYQLDVEMHKGAIVTGRVIDKQTGQGVKAGIRFAPLADNKFYAKPGFDGYDSDRTTAGTESDGSFRLVTIPGRSLIMAQVHADEKFNGHHFCRYRRGVPDEADRKEFQYDPEDDQYRLTTVRNSLELLSTENALKIIDVPESGELNVELLLDRGSTGTVLIQDTDGQPLTDTWLSGMTEHWPINYQVPESQATVYALHADKPRSLALYHAGRKLGGVVTMRGDETEPVAAKLQPLGNVAGRFVDAAGNAMADVEVYVNPVATTGSELYRFVPGLKETVITDREGRFKLNGVVPGMKFYLGIRQGQRSFTGKPKIGELEVKSGETLEVGDKAIVTR